MMLLLHISSGNASRSPSAPCRGRGDNAGRAPHSVPPSDLRDNPRDKPRVWAQRQPRPPRVGDTLPTFPSRGALRLRRSPHPHPRRGRAGLGAAPAPSPSRPPPAASRHWRAPPPAAGRAAVHMACLMAAFSLGSALVRLALAFPRAPGGGRGARLGDGDGAKAPRAVPETLPEGKKTGAAGCRMEG